MAQSLLVWTHGILLFSLLFSLSKAYRMAIHVALNHVTHYTYDRPIKLGPQVVRLRPAPHSRTKVLSYSQRVDPAQHVEVNETVIDRRDDSISHEYGAPGNYVLGANIAGFVRVAESMRMLGVI